ncbi:TlpA family protein disulfide reductase [Kiloniella laminariae]|uniref:TlpA family protein disulfide reductase n=1 Tax=Kiloniella laminariae TaxID=454162 RepID=UPI00035EAD0A|nr:TlpA disulfide reductase family protein [Kiloniella laminariae]
MTLAYAYRVFSVFIGLYSAVLFLQITGASAETSNKPPLEGRLEGNFTLFDPPVPVPIESFEDEEGNLRSLKDFEGQVLLLNFWATWCPPCIKEMPDLDKLQAELGNVSFRVVTLSEDRGGLKQVVPFLNDNALKNLPPYVDVKGRVARAFGLKGLPSTYLINKEGLIVGALIGPFEWSAPEVKKLITFYTK